MNHNPSVGIAPSVKQKKMSENERARMIPVNQFSFDATPDHN
jgi:hypothetical protein